MTLITDAVAPPHVVPFDRVAHGPQPADQLDTLGNGTRIWLGRGNLRADVHVHADHAERRDRAGGLGGPRGPLDVHAELRLLLAGRDVTVGLGVHVGIDAQRDRGDLAGRGGHAG